jgi:hypothetical protein
MNERKAGQVGVEYLTLTVFIMVAVMIIFGFSFANYSHNIRIAKANEALARMGNAIDDVFTRGEGNSRFPSISFPDGLTNIKIVHKCKYGPYTQGSLSDCEDQFGGPATYNDIEFSAISITVQMLLGETEIMRETKAKILEELGEIDDPSPSNPALNKFAGVTYAMRVSWTDKDLAEVPLGTWVTKLEKV